jgi:hypothetical protein
VPWSQGQAGARLNGFVDKEPDCDYNPLKSEKWYELVLKKAMSNRRAVRAATQYPVGESRANCSRSSRTASTTTTTGSSLGSTNDDSGSGSSSSSRQQAAAVTNSPYLKPIFYII